MLQLGKIKDCKVQDCNVTVAFERGEVEVRVITEKIIRIFSQVSQERSSSKAVEEIRCTGAAFSCELLDGELRIVTSELTVKVSEEGAVDFLDKAGFPICMEYRGERKNSRPALSEMQMKFMEQEGHEISLEGPERKISVLKKMDGDECFYGLGDKTGFLNKRGYEYMNWNTDNPDPHVDSFTALYKSIPFLITLKKDHVFGLFFDNTFRTWFDLGKESEDYYGFSAQDGNLDYYFIGGASMKEVVRGYTYLTGTVPLPQRWTLGYHQSRWGYQCEADIRRIAEGMRENQVPCDAVHMDIDYMERYKVFTVDPGRFPDLKGLMDEMHQRGMHLVTIMDPGVKLEEGYQVYEEGIREGYFAKNPDGSVYENAVWPGTSVFPDFGQPQVRSWWGENHRALVEAGVDGIWNDMNEPASFRGELPPEVVFFDEDRITCHKEMHNVYGHNMARATYQGLKELTGKRPFIITRACYSGTQKYAMGWTGDNHSIWAHLQMLIPQLCSLGLSGMGFAGTDIGGFGSDTTKELMCRWIEAGSFSPFCRNHSAAGTREQEPWTFDEETTAIYRKYLGLRYALLPYYYDLFREQELLGLPVMRPVVLNYEEDPETRSLNGEFMIGENLLVAPVVEQGAVRKLVYLPEGQWYDYWTGELLSGKQYVIRSASLEECPLYVKAGSILPKYHAGLTTREGLDGTLILEVYPGDCQYLHYQDNGEDFAYRQGAYNLYRITLEGDSLGIRLIHSRQERPYEHLEIRCRGKEWKLPFENGMTVELK
ncbi:MAG: glycoside hydrolase family 31 protein [Eubacteriales bacterium]|nr:glycoside hydrolase family 31 protein [Eubacteriales bacterium]